MQRRRRAPLLATLALAALLALAACGQPAAPVDPATLPQDFAFDVANKDDLSGAVFAPVFEPFGGYTGPLAAGAIAPAQATALRDAMDGATLALSGTVAGTLTPVAELARLNEAIGFLMDSGQVFFVPEDCDVTAENATEAAFGTMLELIVWDGATLDADGMPATIDGVLDLVVAVGWQFLRITDDASAGEARVSFETVSLEDVAAAGVIGLADTGGGGGPILLGTGARRPTPIFR